MREVFQTIEHRTSGRRFRFQFRMVDVCIFLDEVGQTPFQTEIFTLHLMLTELFMELELSFRPRDPGQQRHFSRPAQTA